MVDEKADPSSVVRRPSSEALAILSALLDDPVLMHEVLFERRHKDATPGFHREMIERWWGGELRCADEAFRGGGKSTIAEDAICAMGLVGFFRYCLIVGNTEGRAVERLSAIKHEIETNEVIHRLFGAMQGSVWNEAEVILANDVMIAAKGARQSLRGSKHWDQRPDILFVDDLEDEENVASPEARLKTRQWFWRSLIPACEPGARIRVVGTPLHPESLLEHIRRDAGWAFHVYPIVVPALTEPAAWSHSNWPERHSLDNIRQLRDEALRVGDMQGFVQEYLCQAEEPALKVFQPQHRVMAPSIPTWAPVMVAVDPARTARPGQSARTGYVAFSWVGSKLYVRQAYGAYHSPAEIIAECFRLDRALNPVKLGVEKDGLEEFLLQPLRQEVLRTGQPLPLVALAAPRDRNKVRFIASLQAFFAAGDILLCGHFPDLVAEMDGFPRGLIDVINALAYAPGMRGGKPVYEDFGFGHVAPELAPASGQRCYVTLSSRPGYTTAVLSQYVNGAFRIFADWVREGDSCAALEQIIGEARLVAGRDVEVFAPGSQLDRYNNSGLPAAVARLRLRVGRLPGQSIGALRPFLQKQSQHQPAFLVASGARWTTGALALGYGYALDGAATLKAVPIDDYYACLMEGLEGLAKRLTVVPAEEEDAPHWAYTKEGHRYLTSAPGLISHGRALDLKRG